MRVLTASFVITSIFLGCATQIKNDQLSTTKLLPPKVDFANNIDSAALKKYLEQTSRTPQPQNLHWWANYKRAQLHIKSNKTLSCSLFNNLSQEMDFPLYQVAKINAFNICSQARYPINYETMPNWLKKMALNSQLNKAFKEQNQKDIIQLAWEKSKWALPKNQKVELTRQALTAAKKVKDKKSIRSLTRRLYKLSPSENKKPHITNWYPVASDFRRKREFKKAIYYYKKIINSRRTSYKRKLAAYRGLSKTYKLMNQKEDYLYATRDLAVYSFKLSKKNRNRSPYVKYFNDNYIKLARTYWTQGKIKDAQKTLKFLERKIKGKYSLARVYWLYGRMAEEKKKYKSALAWFAKAEQEAGKRGYLKEQLQWLQAWNFLKLNSHNEAQDVLQDLSRISSSSYNWPKYKFWLAKSFQESGSYDEAKEHFQDIIAKDHFGYYGLLAHRETQEVLQLPHNNRLLASTVEKLPPIETMNKHLDINTIEWLISLNENELANDYLNDRYREKKSRKANVLLGFLNYYYKSKNYLSLFSRLGALPQKVKEPILVHNPHLAFPQPFKKAVKEASQKYEISSEYIYAIMRQESAFDPKARSHMDAFGLMQLLPRVARQSAEKERIAFEKAEDLFKPQVSIPLGSIHLKELWEKYQGQFVLATASYNASEKTINNWVQTRYKGKPLEFIEDIPYQETRKYIKLVMRNMIYYSIFNAEDKALSFPEWALKISKNTY